MFETKQLFEKQACQVYFSRFFSSLLLVVNFGFCTGFTKAFVLLWNSWLFRREICALNFVVFKTWRTVFTDGVFRLEQVSQKKSLRNFKLRLRESRLCLEKSTASKRLWKVDDQTLKDEGWHGLVYLVCNTTMRGGDVSQCKCLIVGIFVKQLCREKRTISKNQKITEKKVHRQACLIAITGENAPLLNFLFTDAVKPCPFWEFIPN